MKINDSTYSNQSLQASQRVAQTGKVQKIQAPIEPVDNLVENNTQSYSPNSQRSRFDADQSVIALVEQQLQLLPSAAQGKKTDQTIYSQYDEPSKQNQSAVAAYKTVDNIAQRENIKQSFGVNLFA